MGNENERSVTQIDCERCEIATRIEASGLPDSEAEKLIMQHEALDWLIASTPSTNLVELETKIRRFVAAIYPHREPMQPDYLEHALILGVLSDMHAIIGQASNS